MEDVMAAKSVMQQSLFVADEKATPVEVTRALEKIEAGSRRAVLVALVAAAVALIIAVSALGVALWH
jgi:hypothetical protein